MKKYAFIILYWIMCGLVHAADSNSEMGITRYETKEEAMKASGMDVYDTQRNREFSRFTLENHSRVVNYLKSAYAGSWTEYGNDKNMNVVVALARPVYIDKSIFIDDYYKFVYVKYNYEELESVKNKIVDIFMRPAEGRDILIHSVAIKVMENKVGVSVFSKDERRVYDELRRAGFDLDMIYVRLEDQLEQPLLNYYPGTKIWIRGGSGIAQTCTGGFVGNVGIYHVLLTSGHCFKYFANEVRFDTGYGIWGDLIGHPLTSVYGGLYGMDYGAFSNHNFIHTIYAGIRVPPSTVKAVKSPIEISGPLIGKEVCTYRQSQGWGCGKILEINKTFYNNENILLNNFATINLCSVVGDSGGPAVLSVGDNALGIVATGRCGSFGGGGGSAGETSFQPIMPVIRAINNFNFWTN